VLLLLPRASLFGIVFLMQPFGFVGDFNFNQFINPCFRIIMTFKIMRCG